MKKTWRLLNTPVYLGLLTLNISEILMHEFCYDYVKPKNCEKAKICYMDTNIFLVCIKNR